MRWPAKRILESSPKSFGMYEKAMAMEKSGADLIHLEVGRPNFDTPLHIKEATKAALDAGLVHYGEFAGSVGLRDALCRKLNDQNAIPVTSDEVIVTNGLTHAASVTCLAALDPGDEVILLEPYYPQHVNKIELAGGRIVTAPLDVSRNFSIDGPAIRQCITDKTRMIVLVNPVNPTGRVYTRDELETLAAIAIEYDLLVMSDEVYEQIVFDDHEHISIASLPGMFERTFSQFAFTKAYAMDGWRLGYLAAPAQFIPALLKISVNDVAHVNVFIQEGARAAIEGPQNCLHEMLAEDQRRRDLVHRRLNAIPGIQCALPEATIYAFPSISQYGHASDLAEAILQEAGVVTEAGTFYGASGEGYLRLCFGSETYERLEEAMERIESFFTAQEHMKGRTVSSIDA